METSQIVLNNGLTFLVIATGMVIILVGGFLIKLLIDLSKLTKNIDETTLILKSEVTPTLKEFNKALQSVSSIAKNADKQVDSLSKLVENAIGVSASVLSRAKNVSGGIFKGLAKGLVTVIKMVLTNKKK